MHPWGQPACSRVALPTLRYPTVWWNFYRTSPGQRFFHCWRGLIIYIFSVRGIANNFCQYWSLCWLVMINIASHCQRLVMTTTVLQIGDVYYCLTDWWWLLLSYGLVMSTIVLQIGDYYLYYCLTDCWCLLLSYRLVMTTTCHAGGKRPGRGG